MIDIHCYMKIHELKQKIMKGESFDNDYLFDEFERCRSREPVIYNIETTNACNMRCKMCPRTTMMTIKSNGEVAMCGQDFNNEIIFGDAKRQSLYDIWNGRKYTEFRENHLDLKAGIRCTRRCDMKLVGRFCYHSVLYKN